MNLVIKYQNHDAITEELTAFGLIKQSPDEEGTPPPVLTAWPFFRTSDDVDAITGDILCGVKDIPTELVDSILSMVPASFTVEWRSDKVDKNGKLFPRPTFTVNITDINGDVINTRQQEVGDFA